MLAIHGCDFSGALNPAHKMYAASGQLTADGLLIDRIRMCEDRLDLFYQITTEGGLWGVDLPFSCSSLARQALSVSDALELFQLALRCSRAEFRELVVRKRAVDQPPRFTDLAMQAKSPLARTPLDMQGMTYGALKLLGILLHAGVGIYPLACGSSSAATLFEVYPSYAWKSLRLTRADSIALFIERFNQSCGLHATIDPIIDAYIAALPSAFQTDAKDAVVACCSLAAALHQERFDLDWSLKPAFASQQEWSHASSEGLIVRFIL